MNRMGLGPRPTQRPILPCLPSRTFTFAFRIYVHSTLHRRAFAVCSPSFGSPAPSGRLHPHPTHSSIGVNFSYLLYQVSVHGAEVWNRDLRGRSPRIPDLPALELGARACVLRACDRGCVGVCESQTRCLVRLQMHRADQWMGLSYGGARSMLGPVAGADAILCCCVICATNEMWQLTAGAMVSSTARYEAWTSFIRIRRVTTNSYSAPTVCSTWHVRRRRREGTRGIVTAGLSISGIPITACGDSDSDVWKFPLGSAAL